jgi:hypothetical protein
MKIDSSRLLREVGDTAWRKIDQAMQAGARTEDVIVATVLTHAAIAAHRKFGDWCPNIRDVYRVYIASLAVRLQEVDDGSLDFAKAAADAIGRARSACDE